MIDATDVKAHPTAPSLNTGVPPRLIGRTERCMTSKLHGVCDSKGGPLRLHLSEGQCSDFTAADVLLEDLPPVAAVIGDQGYDSNKIRKMLAQQGIPPCIPLRHCRKKPVHYSKRLDRKGHKIENLFSRQKDWRPIASRYDRCPRLPFCHPPGRHCPLLVMSPDPMDTLENFKALSQKTLTPFLQQGNL